MSWPAAPQPALAEQTSTPPTGLFVAAPIAVPPAPIPQFGPQHYAPQQYPAQQFPAQVSGSNQPAYGKHLPYPMPYAMPIAVPALPGAATKPHPKTFAGLVIAIMVMTVGTLQYNQTRTNKRNPSYRAIAPVPTTLVTTNTPSDLFAEPAGFDAPVGTVAAPGSSVAPPTAAPIPSKASATRGGPLHLGPSAIALNASTYDAAIAQPGMTVVMFGATWCSSCRQLAPKLAWGQARSGSAINLRAVDVDQNPDLADRFGLMSIPATMVYIDGQLFDTKVGGLSQPQVDAWLGSYRPISPEN
jgi:thioredoxin 1